jgi:GT2 family glycosyltransferase
MGKIAAVVVTFNRLPKLKKVLASLEEQTRRPDLLVIVDNAATDGTGEWLREFVAQTPLQTDIVTLPENMGGAGGFSAGMARGYALDADYVWIMDDDGYPEPPALELLEKGLSDACAELGPDVPFACSVVKYTDGSICEMNNPVTTWDWGRLKVKGLNSVLVSQCSFVSVLIPRWVMEMYGLPYKEYFIWFDDAEYTQRITESCPGIQVLDSQVVHDMGENKGVNFSSIDKKNAWKFAYGVRNEGSYRLHHKGIISFMMFSLLLFRQMARGRVDKTLQLVMGKNLFKAICFNPKVDSPANNVLTNQNSDIE